MSIRRGNLWILGIYRFGGPVPSPKHPCADDTCLTLVARKDAKHCRKHAVKTPEHIAKVAAANRGKRRSAAVRQRISELRRAPGETTRTCPACSGTFTVDKPSRSQRFCSRACGYAQRRGEAAPNWATDMPMFDCVVCGAEERQDARTVKRETCSYACKNILQRRRQPNKATDIERLTEAALQRRGWQYEAQVGIPGGGTVDFLLPGPQVVICCDGDYWHRLPGVPEKDARQTAHLESVGYRVFRFWGVEIKADVEACLDRIPRQAEVSRGQ
jgi:very-short-patch-repair endonuclease